MAVKPKITPKQIAAVAMGNALEFYDFIVYAFFAVQIAGAFFPGKDEADKLLAALATFGAGFLTRPIGAWVIGGLGDRIGRKPMMLLSFALIGASSLGLALTPDYRTIGLAAPIIVIGWRLVQGFALGGEVGASTAFLIEAAPPGRGGLYVSFQFLGQNAATLAAGLIGMALSRYLGADALAGWGWRIALGLGAAIVPVGILLRRSLPETLDHAVAATPAPPLASYARVALLALIMLLAGTIATYVLNYLTTYSIHTLRMPAEIAFGATVVVGSCGTLFAPLGGWLSDRIGRKPVLVIPWLLMTAATLPGFWLVNQQRDSLALYLVAAALRIPLAFAQSAALILIVESLPPRIRSGALAVIYAISISVFGGSTQFVVAWLSDITDNPLMPAWYMLGSALIGLVAMTMIRETAPRPIRFLKSPQ